MTASTVSQHLSACVQGTPVEFNVENIARATDIGKVKKIYKLNAARTKGGVETPGGASRTTEDSERKELEVLAVGIMALRGQT